MTRIKNGMLIIEHTPEAICAYCGNVAETRPYGKDGAEICYDCGMLPENKDEVDKNMEKLFANSGKGFIVNAPELKIFSPAEN